MSLFANSACNANLRLIYSQGGINMDKLLKLLSENSGFTTAEIAAMLGELRITLRRRLRNTKIRG